MKPRNLWKPLPVKQYPEVLEQIMCDWGLNVDKLVIATTDMVPILPVPCSCWVGIVLAVLAIHFSLLLIKLLTCQELVKLRLIVSSWSVILIILQSHPTY